MTSREITITNPVDIISSSNTDEWRDQRKQKAVSVSLPLEVVADNMQLFLDDLSMLFDKISTEAGAFKIEEVEVSTAITLSGKFTLLGIGGDIEGQGGLKFVFKKVSSRP